MIKNTIKLYIVNFILIMLLITFIWLQYIRPRIPKDVPFNLSLLGITLISITCFVFIKILKTLIRPKPSKYNTLLYPYLKIIFTPFYHVDNIIFEAPFFRQFLNKISFYLHKFSLLAYYPTLIFYSLFIYTPRLFLLTLFIVDIFYFHRIENMYIFVVIGLLPITFRYFIYSARKLYKEYYNYVDTNFYIYFIPMDEEQELELTDLLLNNKKTQKLETYLFNRSANGWETFDYAPCIKNIGLNIKTNIKNAIELEKFYTIMPMLIYLHEFFGHYDFVLNYYSVNLSLEKLLKEQRYRPRLLGFVLNIIIYTLYLICWLYILIVSLPNLHVTNLEWLFIEKFADKTNPFIDLIIENYDKT